MDLQSVLWLYLILIFVLFVVLFRYTFHALEAFIISITVGLIILFIIYPPGDIDIESEKLSSTALYMFIVTITVFIILIYAIFSAWRVRKSQDLICFPKNK